MSAAERPPRNDHEQLAEGVESDSSLIDEDEDELIDEDEDEDEDENEYISIDLSDFKELKCAICLGIIRNTRTVTECLHRFCKECIEKSMRLGINECPICRVHVPSRRSLREDPNFDKLIAALVPDIDKYEEQEELAFLENRSSHDKEMEAMSVENAPSSSVENAPSERDTSPRKKKARAIAVAFERMRKCEGKDRRDGRKLRNAGEIQVSNENEVLNDNNAGKELCSGVPRKDGERQTQIPQESATIHVDREISSSANFHQTNTLLNDQEKKKQEISQNASISEILTNDIAHIEVEKDHVGGVQSLGFGSVHNVTFQSTTKLSDSFSNFDSASNPQLKEEVISLKEKLAIVEENFKTLKRVMLRYIEMKEGHIPSELITIFGDTTIVADKGSG